MKTPYLLTGILVLLLVLTGCQSTVVPPTQTMGEPNITQIEYQIYGAFTTPETNRQTLIISNESLKYILAGYNYSETFRIQEAIDTQVFRNFTTLFKESSVDTWEYNQTSDINVADVGVAEIIVSYSDGTNKVIKFDPNVPFTYADDKREVLNALSQLSGRYFEKYMQAIQEPSDDTKTITFQPMQCDETPWEEWYAQGNAQFLVEPTDVELINAYYSSQGYDISEVRKVESDMAVCQACSVCTTSYYFTAEVEEDVSLAGWT